MKSSFSRLLSLLFLLCALCVAGKALAGGGHSVTKGNHDGEDATKQANANAVSAALIQASKKPETPVQQSNPNNYVPPPG